MNDINNTKDEAMEKLQLTKTLKHSIAKVKLY